MVGAGVATGGQTTRAGRATAAVPRGEVVSVPYYQEDAVTIYHGDCREILPTLDKVDLVLTDPPYGIGEGKRSQALSRAKLAAARDYGENDWDATPIDDCLIREIRLAGKRACIWGGNYYSHLLDGSPSWLVWDKENGESHFADCELAWTNYGGAVRIKRHLWHGMRRVNSERRDHPTQKPLDVILWALKLCPGDPQTILDPFMGSGTTLRAAKDLQRKAIGIELDERYCEIAARRMAQEVFDFGGAQ